MTTQTEKTPVQLSSEVARVVELETIALRSCSIQFLGPDKGPPTVPGPMSVDIKHSVGFSIELTKKILDLNLGLKLEARDNNDEGPERIHMEAEYVVRYSIGNITGFSEEHYLNFARINGMVNVFPYFRELVHSTTLRMGVPPFVLPLFKVMRTAGKPKSEK